MSSPAAAPAAKRSKSNEATEPVLIYFHDEDGADLFNVAYLTEEQKKTLKITKKAGVQYMSEGDMFSVSEDLSGLEYGSGKRMPCTITELTDFVSVRLVVQLSYVF